MDNLASSGAGAPHGRVYANFGSAYSSIVSSGSYNPIGKFSSNESGRFLSEFYNSSSHYISIFDICHDPWLMDTIQHISKNQHKFFKLSSKGKILLSIRIIMIIPNMNFMRKL